MAGDYTLQIFNWCCIALVVAMFPLMWIKLSYVHTPTLLGKGMRASSPLLMMTQLVGFILMATMTISIEMADSYGEGIPCSIVLVYCYFYSPLSAIATQLRALRVLYLFSPKMRMKLSPHRSKLKWFIIGYTFYWACLTGILVASYKKYRDGSHGCVMYEDWPAVIANLAMQRPWMYIVKKWIKAEKVQDGYDILREMDGLALIFNTGGLYLIPRAFYPQLRYDVVHISVEYVLFFSVVLAYLYSTLIPLLKHWRVCCYRPASRRKISGMIIAAQQQHQQHLTTKSGSQPTLSTQHQPPNLQRLNTAAIAPEQVNNYILRAWDEHEMVMLAQAVPHEWQDCARILRHPSTRDLLHKTAQKFLCPENTRFWVAVDELESRIAPTLEQVREAALGIYYEHIQPGATFEINISAVRRQILARKLGLEQSLKAATYTAAHILSERNGIGLASGSLNGLASHGTAGQISTASPVHGGKSGIGGSVGGGGGSGAGSTMAWSAAPVSTTNAATINVSTNGAATSSTPRVGTVTPSSTAALTDLTIYRSSPLMAAVNATLSANANATGTAGAGAAGTTSTPVNPISLGSSNGSNGNGNGAVSPSPTARFVTITLRSSNSAATTGGNLNTHTSVTASGPLSPSATSSVMSTTGTIIQALQHCYMTEKAEVAKLMRDNLLPQFLSSPDFQAFLKTHEAHV